jgi:hypothetical protein
MPERVIDDAVFQYKDAEGRLLTAVRGEKVDIPDGADLARGDKWGAFTPDGKEPKPPADTLLPDIEAEWTPEEYNRLVDAATADEILDKVNAVAEEDRAEVARRLIESESSRGDTAREDLLAALAQVVESPSSPATVTTTRADDGAESGLGEPSSEGGPGREDLVDFVSTSTIEAVLERVGDDSGTATAYREAEESRGDKARSTLIEKLTKIEYPEG